MKQADRIHGLIGRIARLDAAETWTEDLNPAQLAALIYLARANRFSRSPSHVADYLGATRGTVSQTLKTLERKGYVREFRSAVDKRSISHELTAAGAKAAGRDSALAAAIGRMDAMDAGRLERALEDLLADVLRANGGRAFGICRSCKHIRETADGMSCALLGVPLEPPETESICHEHETA